MAKEQKHTFKSPLTELVKPGVLGQDALFPQARPHNPSRFNIEQIAYSLNQPATSIHTFRRASDGAVGNMLTLQGSTPSAMKTIIIWYEDADHTTEVRTILPGTTKIRRDKGRIVFMTDKDESGPAMIVPATGGNYASPAPIPSLNRRVQLENEQKGWPWWKQSAELVNEKRVEFQALAASEADFGQSETSNKPYGHIKFAVDDSGKEYDAFFYDAQMSKLRNAKLKPGDNLFIEAYIKVGKQAVGKGEFVEWRSARVMSFKKLPQ